MSPRTQLRPPPHERPLLRRRRFREGRRPAVLAVLAVAASAVALLVFLLSAVALHFSPDGLPAPRADGPLASEPLLRPRPSGSAAGGIVRKERGGAVGDGGASRVPGVRASIPGHSPLTNPRPIEVVYALPADDGRGGDSGSAVGIALLLHACTHSALKFFSPSESCGDCIGLSEELAIVRAVMERGYIPLAVSSSDAKRGCWGGPGDVENVKAVLAWFRDGALSARLPEFSGSGGGDATAYPVVAVGASSGGRFAAVLAAEGVADAAVVMVSALGENLRHRLADMGPERMPPVYLAPMVRDRGTTRAAKNDYLSLASEYGGRNEKKSSENGRLLPMRLDLEICVPLPITSGFLHGRVPGLGSAEARAIVSDLATAGHLDATTSLLVEDPTKSDWRDVLRRGCGGAGGGGDEGAGGTGTVGGCLRDQSLAPGRSPLAKALHRAWAFHEYCSEAVFPALDFIERAILIGGRTESG